MNRHYLVKRNKLRVKPRIQREKTPIRHNGLRKYLNTTPKLFKVILDSGDYLVYFYTINLLGRVLGVDIGQLIRDKQVPEPQWAFHGRMMYSEDEARILERIKFGKISYNKLKNDISKLTFGININRLEEMKR